MQCIIAGRHAFAALNSWRWSPTEFSPDTLARAGVHSGDGSVMSRGDQPLCLFDHRECYRQNRRAVAIVGHQYDAGRDIFEWLATRSDLVAHVPRAGAAASWYLPGGALPVAITRSGVTVTWPDAAMMAAAARAHAAEEAHLREQEARLRERVQRLRASEPREPWKV
jgi:hypothetical protein